MIITPILAMDRAPELATVALDRASVRTIDKDGRLHIAVSNISKATVNPYLGEEIPNGKELGLDPKRVYRLLRCPRELEKAAGTFNNLPILDKHIAVSADAPAQELIIGSTGTDAVFEAPYLRNSSVVWVGDAIDDINDETRLDWSCGYHYRADMTPGVFMGLRYDGIMRDIVGNHVALVDEGRAGPDVVVGDSLPGVLRMAKFHSRRALMLSGAVAALVAPKLAQDKKLDLTGVLKGYSAKTPGNRDTLAAAIVAAAKPVLAQDGDVDVGDVVQIIAAIEGVDMPAAEDDITEAAPPPPGGEPPAVDAENDVLSRVMAFIAGKLSDEDAAELAQIAGGQAADEADEDDDDDKPKPAMDAASVRAIVGQSVAEMRDAERLVEPIIGRVTVAQDSAAAILRLALDHAKVDYTGVTGTAALKALVKMIPTGEAAAPPIALDHQTVNNDFRTRFPGAAKLVAQ